jgi:hypothetical protein
MDHLAIEQLLRAARETPRFGYQPYTQAAGDRQPVMEVVEDLVNG